MMDDPIICPGCGESIPEGLIIWLVPESNALAYRIACSESCARLLASTAN